MFSRGLEAGLVASVFGAPFAIVTGGLATVLLTALIAWRYPRLRNYTLDHLGNKTPTPSALKCWGSLSNS